ncbi:Bug family tripartite tricarboxylate transporter substrate binding protein [Muricoccus vinaceus]|uniref:Bug family tripartite tricarboxylate transporter substrate binding protein n=1 Tax=Muricoccus vinaceus TaxID=424704 RepID=A0ABV6J2H4_9PROT
MHWRAPPPRVARRALLCGLAAPGTLRAQDAFPSRGVKLIVPYPPGGSADPPARIIGQRLSTIWGQPVVVENRSGASGMIGAEALARSPPDGYTLGLGNIQTHALNVAMFRRMAYDPVADFAPISLVASTPHAFAVPARSPFASMDDLAEAIRAQPGRLTYGSPGPGSTAHLIEEMWLRRLGLSAVHVAYRGAAPVLNDLLGGSLAFAVSTLPGVMAQAQSGALRLLAITSAARHPDLPAVPTFAELGIGDTAMEAWFAILAPARTPRPIVERIAADIARAQALPETRRMIMAAGLEPLDLGPDATQDFIRAEVQRAVAVGKTVGLEPE